MQQRLCVLSVGLLLAFVSVNLHFLFVLPYVNRFFFSLHVYILFFSLGTNFFLQSPFCSDVFEGGKYYICVFGCLSSFY